MGSGDRTTANDAPFGELLPGERVLWEGRPGAKPRGMYGSVSVAAFYALALVIGLVWLTQIVHGREASTIRWIWAVMFAASVGQWIWTGVGFYRNRSQYSVVRYRLTTDRLLVARGEGASADASAWWVRDLREPSVVERSRKDGRDVVVHSTSEPRLGVIRLEALRDADAVRELLITARAEAANGPHREGPEAAADEELPTDVALQPGERLLWTARPQSAWWYGADDRFNSFAGVLFLAVAVIFVVGFGSASGAPVLVFACVVGGYVSFGRLLVRKARARNTLYALTSRRLLAVRRGGSSSKASQLALVDLRPPKVRDGMLTIEATDMSKQQRQPGSRLMWPFENWSAGPHRVVHVATLAGLPDPDAAARLIAQAQRAG